jgi:multiple sugar transport system ATP-binding protein
MPTIQFENTSKSFGALTVLDKLNLKIDDGEFVVLLGPSGCGKSTLLNILAGLVLQTSGRILIDGRDVTYLDPKDRNLAMVFQSYALYPTKTVRGNLKFALKSRGYPREEIDRRVQSVAKLLQIEALLDRKPAELSGGQRQRVAIGRALVKQVGVCLFDEPLSNLDAKLRTEMRMEIKNLHAKLGNTVVYVTHDQVEAMTMATRIAVMNRGVIEQIGTPDDIYQDPQSLFVAEFVGSPSMNFLDVVVGREGARVFGADDRSGLRFDLTDGKWRSDVRDCRKIRIGIRPEHIVIGPTSADLSRGANVNLRVSYYEKIGAEAIAFFDFEGRKIAARVAPEKVEALAAATTVPVFFPVEQMNLFDQETGRRL